MALVTVDIKDFTDAQQAKILRALCRKDVELREKVAQMLQIAYGVSLSATVRVPEYAIRRSQSSEQQPQQHQHKPHQGPSQASLLMAGISSCRESTSSSEQRSGSTSTTASGSSIEPQFPTTPMKKPYPAVWPAPNLTGGTAADKAVRVDSLSLNPDLSEMASEIDFRDRWAAARAKADAVGLNISRTYSGQSPKGSRSRQGCQTGGNCRGYASDGEAILARRATARANAQRYNCSVCGQLFTKQTNSRHSCRYHNGEFLGRTDMKRKVSLMLDKSAIFCGSTNQISCLAGTMELDSQADVWSDWDEHVCGRMDNQDNRQAYPDGFRWTCCNRSGSRRGCQRTSHRVEPTTAARR